MHVRCSADIRAGNAVTGACAHSSLRLRNEPASRCDGVGAACRAAGDTSRFRTIPVSAVVRAALRSAVPPDTAESLSAPGLRAVTAYERSSRMQQGQGDAWRHGGLAAGGHAPN
jgi:hypothetical protein